MIILLFLALQSFADLQRLDPHGLSDQNIKDVKAFKNECTVCHTQEKGVVKIKPSITETCQTCHNLAPHSGVIEHMSRIFKNSATQNNEPINCTSCHAVHRYGSLESNPASGVVHFVRDIKPPLVFKETKKSMLKRKCEECHKW